MSVNDRAEKEIRAIIVRLRELEFFSDLSSEDDLKLHLSQEQRKALRIAIEELTKVAY